MLLFNLVIYISFLNISNPVIHYVLGIYFKNNSSVYDQCINLLVTKTEKAYNKDECAVNCFKAYKYDI